MTTERATFVATGDRPPGLRALEASAGTGKTYSITSTVLRLVVEGEGLAMDQLLVVTFTKAATAELVDRIRRRLIEGAAALTGALAGDVPPSDDVLAHVLAVASDGIGLEVALRRVETAIQQVDEATISTIHGFCQRVLQQAAFASLVDPGLEVDTDQDRLVRQVVDDWAIALQHDADDAFLDALDACKLTPDLMRRIGQAVAGEPDLRVVPSLDERDPKLLLQDALDGLRRAVERGAEDTMAAALLMDAAPVSEGGGRGSMWASEKIARQIDATRDALDRGALPPAAARTVLHPTGKQNSKGDGMPATTAASPVPAAIERLAATLTEVEQAVRTQLAAHVEGELRRRREQAGTASFADLLRRLDDALDRDVTGALRAELRGTYKAVLIDEFQDTDPVQWRILDGLFGDGRHMDVVGDPKQAIYAWRGADLRTYLRAIEQAGENVWTMRQNWRSDGPYVEACNHLMRGPGTFGMSDDVEYVDVAAPGAHAEARLLAADGTPLSGISITVHQPPSGGDTTVATARRRCAQLTAEEIVEQLASDATIPGREGARRPVGAGDIAVLVRTKSQADMVADALRHRGVPVVLGGGRDVLDSAEVTDVAALLDAMLAPADERALRRVLVGPIGGLDGHAIATLDDRGWETWFGRVARWAGAWRRQGIAAAIDQAMVDGGAEARLAALATGERTLTNLRHLGEVLHRAERDEALGSHGLAAWLGARRVEVGTGQTAEDRELRLERDADAVRVMTIHTSKGLEFPLVWVPFGWGPDLRSETADTRVRPFAVNDPEADHRRTLVLLPAAQDDAAQAPARVRFRALADEAEWESGHRLLYVALTRAAHRTVLHVALRDELPDSSVWHMLLRHAHGVGGPGRDVDLPDEAELIATLEMLAEHPAIDLQVSQASRIPLTLHRGRTATREDELTARTWQRDAPIDVRWGRASYSRLTGGRTAVAVEAPPEDDRDHDADAAEPVEVREPSSSPSVHLVGGPRGKEFGVFIHEVFEHADFDADVDALEATIRERLRVGTYRMSESDIVWLRDGVLAALATPMGGQLGCRLADVPRADRIDELGFLLGLASQDQLLTIGRLADVFDAHADDLAHAGVPLREAAAHLRAGGESDAIHGVLNGYVDLVMRAPDGRVWIVDYKSNSLGDWVEEDGTRRAVETNDHHHPDRVMEAMLHADYLLQSHLYIVAVHRYLRQRMGAAYDYDQHVGGWAYLFVRGMVGPDTPVTEDGRTHGVASGRPSRGMVEDLDAVLEGRAPRGER